MVFCPGPAHAPPPPTHRLADAHGEAGCKNCGCTGMVEDGSLDMQRCLMPMSSDIVGRSDSVGGDGPVVRANCSASLRL